MTIRTRKLLAYAAALVLLLGVFALYMRPQIMVTLAEQVWLCFR